MYKYERIIFWSKDDDAFIVEVPELPGCMADGKQSKKQYKIQKQLFPNGWK